MVRSISWIVACLLLVACGGGGGSSNAEPAPVPPPTDPGDDPTAIALLDSQPGNGSTAASPAGNAISFAHLGQSDLTITLNDDCTAIQKSTVRRSVFDLANSDVDQILEHRLQCDLAENRNVTVSMDGQRSNDASFAAEYSFSTGVTDPSILTVTDQVNRTATDVDDMFTGYVEGSLIDDLELPSGVASLILDTIIELSEANWDNLTDPDALYSVNAAQVSYPSRDPMGGPANLTGLVVTPVIEGTSFTPRDEIIVLTHATGSTPGDLDPADAWFILANQFAARGYLVIAPDNYGRGGTSSEPETYLMASRTADNAIDLLIQVLADTAYDNVYSGNAATIIGYSQGGHSAVDLWLALSTNGPADVSVNRVYAGGAPHNLYQTFRGVIEHLNGSCDDGAYCQFVDSDTTLPFATERILPGFLAYTDTGMTFEDIVSGNTIDPTFVSDFLNDAERVDALKAMLQLSSFSDIQNLDELNLSTDTTIHLYHSDFDRLVPAANTDELASLLGPVMNVDYHTSRCNGTGYELIFGVTETVGTLHTLCGLSVLDDAMEDLK